ncbi:MAG: hypothetical protein JWP89_7085 [Schlesneria sp.]|nr:hypothetical protein [Schlesneria sp.]
MQSHFQNRDEPPQAIGTISGSLRKLRQPTPLAVWPLRMGLGTQVHCLVCRSLEAPKRSHQPGSIATVSERFQMRTPSEDFIALNAFEQLARLTSWQIPHMISCHLHAWSTGNLRPRPAVTAECRPTPRRQSVRFNHNGTFDKRDTVGSLLIR